MPTNTVRLHRVSVDGMPFSATRDDVVRMHGQPLGEGRNEVGLTELDYGDVVYRFQDCGQLEEVTRRAKVLNLNAVSVPFPSLKIFICEQDPRHFARAGFLVSPKFGLAFVPDSPYWVAFALDRVLRKYAMTCENTSLPWCMAILCVGAQKMQSLTLDVQIETGPEIQNWQADHQLIESRRENVGTLLAKHGDDEAGASGRNTGPVACVRQATQARDEHA